MDEYPNLAGQHADYIAQALNDYRLGKRKNPIMQPFAQQLSQDDITRAGEISSPRRRASEPRSTTEAADADMTNVTVTRELHPTRGRYVGRIAGHAGEAELTFERAEARPRSSPTTR